MATHSSILAWEITWPEMPGRLQSVHGVTKSRTRFSDHTTTSHEKSSKVKFHLI